MSAFQCEKCGCVENTALSEMGNDYLDHVLRWAEKSANKKKVQILQSYKVALGSALSDPFPQVCSACCPVWYHEGEFAAAPNPNPTPGLGLWHGEFEQVFLPLGQYETCQSTGDLIHKETKAKWTSKGNK